MPDILADSPALTLEITGTIILPRRPESSEGLSPRVRLAEDRISFGIPEIIKQAIGDVEIVGEQEGTPAERVRCIRLLRRVEHARHQH